MLPAHPLDGLLSAFDQSNTNFALSTPDGRVRTYDTVTGRLRSTLTSAAGALAAKNVPGGSSGHLAEGHRCLTWVDSEETSAKARSGNAAGPSRSWVAVGTSSGGVKLYDSATGEMRWQTTHCNEGGVECLAYSSSRSSVLLSSGRDGQLCSLDTSTGSKQGQFKGSKHGVTAAALSADGSKLILGACSLYLLDMDTQQRITKLTGHQLPVRALTFAPSGAYALSGAEGDRLVAVWATSSKQSGRKRSAGATTAHSLAVEQPVVGLTTAAAEGEGVAGAFYAAATTEAGVVYVWLITPQGDTGVACTQLARVCVASAPSGSSGSSECILAAALEPAAEGVCVLLVCGSPAKPRFERLAISSSGSNKVTYLQPAPADGLIRPAAAANGPATQQQQQQPGSRDVDMLGPDNAGEAVQQRVAAGSNSSRKRHEPEPDGAAAEGGDAAAADEADAEDEEDDSGSGEPTLGQRVADLEQQQQQAVAGAGEQQQQQAASAGLPPGPLKADSLGVLLTQALRSADVALLEQCLGVAHERVIANTVKRLVPLDAALLLRAAVERLQSKPARGQQLAAWIHAVLLHHTAYLMAAPGAAPVMSSLYQIIEGRLAMQRQLLSLAGRLELLLAQAGGKQGEAAAAGGDTGPRVVYQESDSEAEVEIVDAAAGDSDDAGEFYTDEEEDDASDEEDEEGSED